MLTKKANHSLSTKICSGKDSLRLTFTRTLAKWPKVLFVVASSKAIGVPTPHSIEKITLGLQYSREDPSVLSSTVNKTFFVC
ncbi:hypothetical protein Lalb_Chr18g0052751 [Lupinus albus]|uniref:Uncharacterized protein n=1 Tax=Lupinus albus TaxID=3870 RepID=A0A6A4P5H5_LUPAL|nr:hypothetical protein Lalb_Chr18g0052751 [Lupinus albus]